MAENNEPIDGGTEPKIEKPAEPKAEKTYTQSEFNKAMEELKAEYEKKTEKKLSEAEKFAKMNEDEKKAFEYNKQVEELNEREKKIAERELKQTAKELLIEKNLPVDLLGIVNYASAESCKKSIDSIAKAFDSAVSAEVDRKLKKSGGSVRADGSNQSMSGVEAAFYALNPGLKK